MRQTWSHTLLQVSKSLRRNLLSLFSTLTFAFLFSATLFLKCSCPFKGMSQQHNTKDISGSGLLFSSFLWLNGGSVSTLVSDIGAASPRTVLEKNKSKHKQSRPWVQIKASSPACLDICVRPRLLVFCRQLCSTLWTVSSLCPTQTHTGVRTHTLAFPRALKTAVAPDPCHVNGASSAPPGKLKWRLASLALLEKVLGSKSMWTCADCQISSVVRSSQYLVCTAWPTFFWYKSPMKVSRSMSGLLLIRHLS